MAASRQPVIDFVSLPLNFFARPAQIVGPDLVGCRLVKRQADGKVGSLLWGVMWKQRPIPRTIPLVMATAAVHRKTKPCSVSQGLRFYVYVSYGIHHCVNVVTDRVRSGANGVLLRAVALPDEPERIAAGPGLLARRFGLDRRDDSRPA